MAESKERATVRSPLQLFGLYLAWTESALAASLIAIGDHPIKGWLVAVMIFGLFAYVLVAGFLLVYLGIKRPHFLFNPSDYDKSVQPMLFDQHGGDVVEVEIAPVDQLEAPEETNPDE